MSKQVLLKDLKVGDRLVDNESGLYTDLVVSEITVTKNGRYHISVDGYKVGEDGSLTPVKNMRLFYAPISGNRHSLLVK